MTRGLGSVTCGRRARLLQHATSCCHCGSCCCHHLCPATSPSVVGPRGRRYGQCIEAQTPTSFSASEDSSKQLQLISPSGCHFPQEKSTHFSLQLFLTRSPTPLHITEVSVTECLLFRHLCYTKKRAISNGQPINNI